MTDYNQQADYFNRVTTNQYPEAQQSSIFNIGNTEDIAALKFK